MDEYAQLKEFYLSLFHIKDANLLRQMCEASSLVHVAKGKTLFSKGDVVPVFYFLRDGGLRFYYFDRHGHEITDCFWYHTGDPVAPSFHPEQPSVGFAVAFRDTSLVAIPWQKLMQAISNNFEGRDIYERILVATADQHCFFKALISSTTTAERYAWFLQAYPDLENLVSDRCIASYLAMNPVTFSRLRSKQKAAEAEAAGAPSLPAPDCAEDTSESETPDAPECGEQSHG